ncbi:SGNH/GDSL hydrolase family protein [Fibrella aquatica]|uniref:SGNH/GDSL hydrolase family protein n=1 Tax=Fibrella aquatica TaxID=3242487 RepID=UPI003520E031
MKRNFLIGLLLSAVIICLLSSFARKELSWVAIGDSITYLNDHQDQTGNRITKGYMTRLVEQLPYIRYVNQGHNGWTAGRIASSIDNLGLAKADVYSIFLGTNDWWQGRPLGRLNDYQRNTGNATVYGSFRLIIDKIRSLNPEAPIILITPMQRADFVYIANPKNNAYGSYKAKNGQSLEAFALAIDSIGQAENLPVLDLYHTKKLAIKHLVKYKRLKDPTTGVYKNYRYPAFIDVPFNPETDEYPYPVGAINKTYDGLHPSDDAYALITRKLVKLMKRW